MAIAPVSVFGPSVITNGSQGQLYVSPNGVKTTITRMVFNNTSASPINLQVWLVRMGQSITTSELVIGAAAGGLSMAAGASAPYIADAFAGMVLNPGDAIWAEASGAGLNGVASGWTQ